MEIMEDGNLMDRVQILIQRDLQYYQEKQTVLQETICPGVVGGKLDFPRHASFAAVKLVLWWEEEYVAAYRKCSGLMEGSVETTQETSDELFGGCGGVIKSSDPEKFVSMVTKSAEQLLAHLHVLSQEALDHADLTVLTGTLGASAMIKNCIWCYIQSSGSSTVQSDSMTLQTSYKKYSEMAEAIAERLLDLHCRLMSLYILQDAESLDWENMHPFFESERGSFTIQMWWFYMHGTKEDLWNTVPPKIAQRIFSGMLNETLTILTVRYTQAKPSEARSKLLIVDISNVLLCVNELLPSICGNAEESTGLSLSAHNKILRDIHAKCHELLCCFLLRGASLEILHKVFKQGVDNLEILKPCHGSLHPWLLLTSPELFASYKNKIINKIDDLDDYSAISLEFKVLTSQPQPCWSHLLRILLMRQCKVGSVILRYMMKNIINVSFGVDNFKLKKIPCEGFLCNGDGTCKYPQMKSGTSLDALYCEIVKAIVYILTSMSTKEILKQTFLPALEQCGRTWAVCLDRRQVWNQNKPPWLHAILAHINPVLPPIITTLISAVQTGASMYQAMSLTIACFSQLWEIIPPQVATVSSLLSDIVPADVNPLSDSVLLQLLITALYGGLYERIQEENVKAISTLDETESCSQSRVGSISVARPHKDSVVSFDGGVNDVGSICTALAEALCSIDEDNKHTEQINDFIEQTRVHDILTDEVDLLLDQSSFLAEVNTSEILMSQEGKLAFKVLYNFIVHNQNWILQELKGEKNAKPHKPNRMCTEESPFLYRAFHIGDRSFDQLLTGDWKPDWLRLLQLPLGLSVDRIWSQISQRWEFRETDTSQLCLHDRAVVANLISCLKQ